MTITTVTILLLVLLNFFGFSLVGHDKSRSRRGVERIPEVYFFIAAIFMASAGVLAGMIFFRNKTKKLYFWIAFLVLLIQQIVLLRLIFALF